MHNYAAFEAKSKYLESIKGRLKLLPIQSDSDKWIPPFYREFVYQNHQEKVLL
jgi:hypothetical protein